jgi:hypothetical protein
LRHHRRMWTSLSLIASFPLELTWWYTTSDEWIDWTRGSLHNAQYGLWHESLVVSWKERLVGLSSIKAKNICRRVKYLFKISSNSFQRILRNIRNTPNGAFLGLHFWIVI